LEEKDIFKLLQQPDKCRYAGLRYYALICLQVDKGISQGEALQLRPDDFHHEKGEKVIRAELAKSRTLRVIPLAPPTESPRRAYWYNEKGSRYR
jgi:integrase